MKKFWRSLQNKFILSLLAVAVITVIVVSLGIRLTSGQSLMNLVTDQQTAQLSDAVQTYYTANGSLDGFLDYYRKYYPPTSGQPQPKDGNTTVPPAKNDAFRGVYGLVDTNYRAILPTLGNTVGQTVPQDQIRKKVAVAVNGQTIAWILPDTSHQFQLSPQEQQFLQRSNLAILIAALVGVAAAVFMGLFLSNRLTKPIRSLTRASQALAQGDLSQQVPVTSQDELGQLAATFNQMSAELAHADTQRKRLTADITHDLSTPIQIIAGYMEIIEEGDVNLTPQRVEIIKTELDHLRRLVNDLNTLSQIEGGSLEIDLEPLNVPALLDRVRQTYAPIAASQHVTLALEVPGSADLTILADEGRMLQVLKNLVDNALRYTPAEGTVTLSAARREQQVAIAVTDTGSGIDPEDLPFVFDRFYQAEKSRGANQGKMGLGLAICKALIGAQNGEIAVTSAGKAQGTAFTITFPAFDAPQPALNG